MLRNNRPDGGPVGRPAAAAGGPSVRRAVVMPSVGEDPLQALRPAARNSGIGGEPRPETVSGTTARASADTAEAAPRTSQPQAEPSAGTRSSMRNSTRADARLRAAASRAAGAAYGLAAAGTAARGGNGAANGAGDSAGDGSPGRPKTSMLAAAGIAGLVLISVPLLVMAGDDSDERTGRDRVAIAADFEGSKGERNTDTDTLYDDRVVQPPEVYAPRKPANDSSGADDSAASDRSEAGKSGKAEPAAAPTETAEDPGAVDPGARNVQKQKVGPSSAPSADAQTKQPELSSPLMEQPEKQELMVGVAEVAPAAKVKKSGTSSGSAEETEKTEKTDTVEAAGAPEEERQAEEQFLPERNPAPGERTLVAGVRIPAPLAVAVGERIPAPLAVTVYAYRLVSADSGKCLVTTAREVGGELAIMPCGEGEEQYWAFHPDDTIRNGDLCLTLADGSIADNTVIRLENCSGSDAQKFRLNENDDLISLKEPNKCADVLWQDDFDGAPVRLWPCNGGANQTWKRG